MLGAHRVTRERTPENAPRGEPARPRHESPRGVSRVRAGAISNARTVIAGRLVAASAWGMVLCVCAVWAVRRVLDSSALDAVVRAFGSCERRSTLTGLRVGRCDLRTMLAKDRKKEREKVAFRAIFFVFFARSSAIFVGRVIAHTSRHKRSTTRVPTRVHDSVSRTAIRFEPSARA